MNRREWLGGEQLKKEKEKTEDLQEKMEKFKNRLVAVEKAKQAQLEELKLAMQNQRKSVLSR